MTQPIMEEGRWAVLRNGSVAGPIEANTGFYKNTHPWREPGQGYTFANNGAWSEKGAPGEPFDIIATFATRAEAEDYTPGETDLVKMIRHGRSMFAECDVPVEVAPAPAVDWDQRRWEAALAATDGDIEAHRPLRRDGQGFGMYHCTREEALLRFADALIAALKGETK